MTKLNRREYLKQMGASAAVVAGLAAGVVGEPQRRVRRRRPVKAPTKPTTMASMATGNLQFADCPATTTPPELNAPVTLIFGGLMGFFYNGSCEIGLHPGHNHTPMIRFWEKTTCTRMREDFLLPNRCKRMIVEINRRNSMVNFFEASPEAPFSDRINGHQHDFRWLLDLHGSDFYPSSDFPMQKRFNRLLKVRHGTFYTRVVSVSTFDRVDIDDEADDKMAIGRVPLYMAAAIVPAAGETVTLRLQEHLGHKFVDYDEIPLTPAAGKKTEVQFFNHCLENHGCPEMKPDAHDDEDRNDFHFVREVVNPSTKPKYGLKLKVRGDHEPVRDFCLDAAEVKEKVRVISDPAPCMGAGYGGGGGCNC